MKPFILTDLDDSLFGTEPKVPADQREGLVIASRLADGSPSGYFTRRQKRFVESLFDLGTVVPVTARSLDALRRVEIAWPAEAICAHGGLIVHPAGHLDPDWLATLQAAQAAESHMLEVAAVFDLVQAELAGTEGFRRWIIQEEIAPARAFDLYVVVKHESRAEAALAPLARAMRDALGADWTVHLNGNNLAILPKWLDKRHAVRFLLERIRDQHPHAPVIGIGDSHADLPFLGECDYMMTPVRGQIADSIRKIDAHACL